MWEELLPSDWMQCVVESAPDSMSVSSGEHLKEQDNKSYKHVSAVRHHSAELSVPRVLLLVWRRADVQNLTLLLECWTGISSHENAGVSLVVTLGALWLAVSLGVSASKRGGNQFLKEKKGEKINFITFTKQHKRNNSIFEGSNNSGSIYSPGEAKEEIIRFRC